MEAAYPQDMVWHGACGGKPGEAAEREPRWDNHELEGLLHETLDSQVGKQVHADKTNGK